MQLLDVLWSILTGMKALTGGISLLWVSEILPSQSDPAFILEYSANVIISS